MAVTTTARRVLATGAIAGTALLALALPASAHTHDIDAKCNPNGKTTLTIDLRAYNGKQANTVKATDGDTVLVDESFKNEYTHTFELPADQAHDFVVDVHAWDGDQYSKHWTQHVDACVTPPTTTTTTPSETTTTTVAPTSTTSEAPVPPATTTPPAQQGGGLPDTGANVGLPLGIGALLVVGGGALLLVVRKRRTA